MIFLDEDKLKLISVYIGGFILDDTHEFVEKLHEKQAKAEKYSKRKGNSHASNKLPSKQPKQN